MLLCRAWGNRGDEISMRLRNARNQQNHNKNQHEEHLYIIWRRYISFECNSCNNNMKKRRKSKLQKQNHETRNKQYIKPRYLYGKQTNDIKRFRECSVNYYLIVSLPHETEPAFHLEVFHQNTNINYRVVAASTYRGANTGLTTNFRFRSWS